MFMGSNSQKSITYSYANHLQPLKKVFERPIVKVEYIISLLTTKHTNIKSLIENLKNSV